MAEVIGEKQGPQGKYVSAIAIEENRGASSPPRWVSPLVDLASKTPDILTRLVHTVSDGGSGWLVSDTEPHRDRHLWLLASERR